MKNDSFKSFRMDDEPPVSVSNWGWKFHHLGIPTNIKMPDEIYIPQYKVYVSGFSSSPFGIEWMRYEKNSPINKLIQSVPHIAFEVEDIDLEMAEHDLNILTEPNTPAPGIRVAMIEHNGAPVELIEFKKK